MGLDMYLSVEIYLSKYNNKDKSDKIRELFPEIKATGNIDFTKVSFEVGYWRKANQIHNWFVENVQDGSDDCGDYYVAREQLEELKAICETGLKRKNEAEEILPTKEGFFFGTTEYDEWYFKDLEHTIKVIDYCLSLPKDYDFNYHSSW